MFYKHGATIFKTTKFLLHTVKYVPDSYNECLHAHVCLRVSVMSEVKQSNFVASVFFSVTKIIITLEIVFVFQEALYGLCMFDEYC